MKVKDKEDFIKRFIFYETSRIGDYNGPAYMCVQNATLWFTKDHMDNTPLKELAEVYNKNIDALIIKLESEKIINFITKH